MEDQKISELSVSASGVWPVELSVGKRIDARHRVTVKASVDRSTGEVRFYVDSEAIEVLTRDSDRG
jgi:hypothetical protein